MIITFLFLFLILLFDVMWLIYCVYRILKKGARNDTLTAISGILLGVVIAYTLMKVVSIIG